MVILPTSGLLIIATTLCMVDKFAILIICKTFGLISSTVKSLIINVVPCFML